MSVQWPRRHSLAQLPTPLQLLKRLSTRLKGPNIWVKRDDLTGSVLSGNKVRKLEFTLALVQEQGADLLLTCGGLQSNHCRATAFIGAQLGIPVHLVLRGEPTEPDGNLFLDQLSGARISCYPPREYQADLDGLLEHWANHYRQRGYQPHIIPTGASDGLGVWGYFNAARELQSDCHSQGISPDLVVTATGSGGTQAGLTLGSDYFALGCAVLGFAVCADAGYFQAKVKQDIAQFSSLFAKRLSQPINTHLHVHTNDRYIGEGYGLASREVLETIALVAREEGLVLDPVYTGKAFHGLLHEIQQGNLAGMKDIVFIHTGGLFGLYPYRQRFQSILAPIEGSRSS